MVCATGAIYPELNIRIDRRIFPKDAERWKAHVGNDTFTINNELCNACFYLFCFNFNECPLGEIRKKNPGKPCFLFSLWTTRWIVALLLSGSLPPYPGLFPKVKQIRKYGTYHGAQKEAKAYECPSRVFWRGNEGISRQWRGTHCAGTNSRSRSAVHSWDNNKKGKCKCQLALTNIHGFSAHHSVEGTAELPGRRPPPVLAPQWQHAQCFDWCCWCLGGTIQINKGIPSFLPWTHWWMAPGDDLRLFVTIKLKSDIPEKDATLGQLAIQFTKEFACMSTY